MKTSGVPENSKYLKNFNSIISSSKWEIWQINPGLLKLLYFSILTEIPIFPWNFGGTGLKYFHIPVDICGWEIIRNHLDACFTDDGPGNDVYTFVNMRMTEIGSLALKHMFSMFFSLLRLLGENVHKNLYNH